MICLDFCSCNYPSRWSPLPEKKGKQRIRILSSSFTSHLKLERTTGIEPASSAWEADILPMNYVRICPFWLSSENLYLYYTTLWGFLPVSFSHFSFSSGCLQKNIKKHFFFRVQFLSQFPSETVPPPTVKLCWFHLPCPVLAENSTLEEFDKNVSIVRSVSNFFRK